MRTNPEIQALLADPTRLASQQNLHAQAFADWRAGEGAGLSAAFAAYAAGAPLSSLPELGRLFDGSGRARALLSSMVAAMLPAMRAAPFGQIQLRHNVSANAATLLLDRHQDASLTLVAVEGTGRPGQQATSAAFSPAEEWDAVIAGSGTARLVERHGAPGLAVHQIRLEAGLALGRDAQREALLIDHAETPLLLLRLQRRRPGPEPVREFDLESGAQIHQSAASPRQSRLEIAATLLGRMGRVDAAPEMAEVARDRTCGDMLRWQAACECLALDTLAGFRTLAALACEPADPLAAIAGALRARLIEQHPVLAGIEPCPA